MIDINNNNIKNQIADLDGMRDQFINALINLKNADSDKLRLKSIRELSEIKHGYIYTINAIEDYIINNEI